MARNPFEETAKAGRQPGANFNQLLELAIRLENARTFAGTKVADASTEMEQSEFLEPKRIDIFGNVIPAETLEDWDVSFRRPNAAGGRIYGKYAQQLASGGRVGYDKGDVVLPKAKPYNAETFKEKSDLYLQAILGTSDKDFYRSKLQNEYEKAMKEGALSAKEATEWVRERAKLYSTLIDESRRQERTLSQELRGIGSFSLPTPYGVEPDINKYYEDKKAMGGRVGLVTGSGDHAKKYLKYGDKATQDKFNKLVNELSINMSFESAISEALREIREGSD